MSPRLRHQIRQTAGLWLAWTVAGLFYITQDTMPRLYRGEPVPWTYVFVGWMTGMYVCAALTPLLLWLGDRWPIERRVAHLGIHLCFAVVFSVVSTAIEAPLLMLFGVFPAAVPPVSVTEGIKLLLSYGPQGGVIRYGAVVAVQAVYRLHQSAKARERESFELKVQSSDLARQLAAAQMSALKMQLQPHFLFNTLGAIIVLIQQQQTSRAEAMVAKLGDLLRLTLDDVEAQEVPLWRELDFLRLYLSIEQVRFEDRLRVNVAAEPRVAEALVPHMVLQPIVENAVRHGLGQSEEGIVIDVNATAVHSTLVLVVSNDGPGLPAPGIGQTGIGLTNTRNRLARLYGPEASLIMENVLPRGVRVTIPLSSPSDWSGRGGAVHLKVLVVDDEPLAREGLKRLLSGMSGVGMVSEARNGREAIVFIRDQKPDLVLLDVQMPRVDGFAVVQAVGAARMPAVIFVTAHDKYAIRAFEIAAVDYLLKPVTEERFSLAFARATSRLQVAPREDETRQVLATLDALANPPRPLTRFAIRSGERTFFVPLEDVERIEALQNYVQLHVGAVTHLLHVPMNTIESVLDPARFLRVHRSHIVNVRRISQLWSIAHGQYMIELVSGLRLQSGRTYGDRIRRALSNPF